MVLDSPRLKTSNPVSYTHLDVYKRQDYVIPGNDDAIRAVKLISATMANAIIEGRQGAQAEEAAAQKAEAEAEEDAEAKA